jgi:stage II sporulation protein R
VKKLMSFLMIILFVGLCVGCGEKTNSVVRIHIRANSNSEEDQSIKLLVRDSIINCITPMIAECESSDDVKYMLSCNIDLIESIADNVLSNNGFDYHSDASINYEYFPSRSYDGEVFPADYYDALIVELGTGKGDNWWCVAYPPLCFVGDDVGTNCVKYKSKLLELINDFLG